MGHLMIVLVRHIWHPPIGRLKTLRAGRHSKPINSLGRDSMSNNSTNTHNAEVHIRPEISDSARSLARTADRLPAGTHRIELCKRPGMPWTVRVSEAGVTKEIDR